MPLAAMKPALRNPNLIMVGGIDQLLLTINLS